SCLFSSYCSGDLPYPHSSPTRRSSDLVRAVLVRVQAAHDVDEGARGQLLAQPGALLRQESVILLIAAPRGEILPGVRDVQVAQQQELATGRRGRAAGPGEVARECG